MKIKEKLIRLTTNYSKELFKKLKANENVTKLKLVKKFKKTSLKHVFISFGLPFILSAIIINWFHGHFSTIAIDAIFVALTIITPVLFSFMLAIFTIDKELLLNERDHKIVKDFNEDVSFLIIICLISIFLILLKILFEDLVGNIDTFLDFLVVWSLIIIGFNLLEILDMLSFLVKERLREINPKNK